MKNIDYFVGSMRAVMLFVCLFFCEGGDVSHSLKQSAKLQTGRYTTQN